MQSLMLGGLVKVAVRQSPNNNYGGMKIDHNN